MTKEEAREIIDRCKNWNTSQTGIAYAMRGERSPEDDVYDERRKTLAEAWRTLRGEPNEGRHCHDCQGGHYVSGRDEQEIVPCPGI